MEIKEAVEIVRKNKGYNGCLTKNSWEEVNEAFNIIEKAIVDGYTLCEVDKLLENIEIIKVDVFRDYGSGHQYNLDDMDNLFNLIINQIKEEDK